MMVRPLDKLAAHHEGVVLVSDDPARAAAEFPEATVLRRPENVVALPAGTAVGLKVYALTPATLTALDAARLLIAAGVIEEVRSG